MTDEERLALFRACERTLHGHGSRTPKETLEALAAEVGPEERADIYGTGALIEDLEREVAELLGKPAAVFMPSGHMAQQIALRIWAERKRCRTVAFHPTCHLELHEQRGYSFLHGLRARLVGPKNGLLTLAELEAIHEPLAALLLELPQREIGGWLPSWEDLTAQTRWAAERGIARHLDGARLWETQPFFGRELATIAGEFDSVYVSFYKILGAPAGAALAGPADFIAEARVWLRRHGGNLYALYPYVLGARLGLRQRLPRIPAYCDRAATIARILAAIPGISVTPDPPHTNMMHVTFRGDRERLLDASTAIAREEKVGLVPRLRPCDVPGHHVMEVSIGEAAFALSDDEIDSLFRRVVA